MTMELVQQEKLATLGLLASSVTHEINNPNNFIIFNLPILKDYVSAMLSIVEERAEGEIEFSVMGMPIDAFREDTLKLLASIQNGAERIQATVAGFNGFSKKRTDATRELVHPGDSIEKAVFICRYQIHRTIRDFTIDLEAPLPPIRAIPGALEQVMSNLLINATQAADKEQSCLALRAFVDEAPERRLVVEIADNGCGMDEETQKKLFFPFFTARKDGTGTGLGLYIVKGMVDEMSGRIEVRSRPGEGSTFTLSLPVVEINPLP